LQVRPAQATPAMQLELVQQKPGKSHDRPSSEDNQMKYSNDRSTVVQIIA